MDMPEKCVACPCMQEYISDYCGTNGKELNGQTKPDWCPLKPLPEKQAITFAKHGEDMMAMGWNACIEAIEEN